MIVPKEWKSVRECSRSSMAKAEYVFITTFDVCGNLEMMSRPRRMVQSYAWRVSLRPMNFEKPTIQRS